MAETPNLYLGSFHGPHADPIYPLSEKWTTDQDAIDILAQLRRTFLPMLQNRPVSDLVAECSLSQRAVNVLKKAKITTMKQLIELPARTVVHLPNSGRKTAEEVYTALRVLKIEAPGWREGLIDWLKLTKGKCYGRI